LRLITALEIYKGNDKSGYFCRVIRENLWSPPASFWTIFPSHLYISSGGRTSLTIRELIEEQRVRLSSCNPAERFAAGLLISGVLAKRLRVLNDRQIAELLDDDVGPRLNLLAPEATICMAAAERLRRHVTNSPECRRFQLLRAVRRSFAVRRDEGTHILSAEVALYRAGISFLQLPWQRNRFASSTLMVMNVAEARDCLLRTGFRESPRSPIVFIDCRTRQPIQLYEDRTQFPPSPRRN
jgi:hypothetical protein